MRRLCDDGGYWESGAARQHVALAREPVDVGALRVEGGGNAEQGNCAPGGSVENAHFEPPRLLGGVARWFAPHGSGGHHRCHIPLRPGFSQIQGGEFYGLVPTRALSSPGDRSPHFIPCSLSHRAAFYWKLSRFWTPAPLPQRQRCRISSGSASREPCSLLIPIVCPYTLEPPQSSAQGASRSSLLRRTRPKLQRMEGR